MLLSQYQMRMKILNLESFPPLAKGAGGFELFLDPSLQGAQPIFGWTMWQSHS
jgi:hypothetical protein